MIGVCKADMLCNLCSVDLCKPDVTLVSAEGVKCATFLFPATSLPFVVNNTAILFILLD